MRFRPAITTLLSILLLLGAPVFTGQIVKADHCAGDVYNLSDDPQGTIVGSFRYAINHPSAGNIVTNCVQGTLLLNANGQRDYCTIGLDFRFPKRRVERKK